jgi:hypothetical protein
MEETVCEVTGGGARFRNASHHQSAGMKEKVRGLEYFDRCLLQPVDCLVR